MTSEHRGSVLTAANFSSFALTPPDKACKEPARRRYRFILRAWKNSIAIPTIRKNALKPKAHSPAPVKAAKAPVKALGRNVVRWVRVRHTKQRWTGPA